MDTETLLEQHQHDLRELCAEFWGYALSTAPADRERLERAIARVYQDHDLKPRYVLWVNSVLDAKCCAALCTFISDPNVHFSMTGPFGLWKGRQGPVTNTPLLQGSFCGESFQCFNPLGEAITCAQAQAREVLGLERIPAAEPLIEAVKAGGWWWPLEGICIAIDNPLEIHFDARFRFHNDNGMAFCFREIDFGFWSVHRVRVPEKVMTDQFSVDDILTERNAEVRRVMINRYGISRFLIDSDAEKIDVDEFGTLYRQALSGTRNAQLCVVEVINKTPEPDGSFKIYHLHVPPNIMSAREAVAWTFGMRAEEYNPLQES